VSWFQQRFDQMPGRKQVDCEQCGRSMWFPPSKAGKYRTCGGSCAKERFAAPAVARTTACKTCGAEFTPRPTQLRAGHGLFCSQACNTHSHAAMNQPEAQKKAQRAFKEAIESGRYKPAAGEHAPRWRGGPEAQMRRLIESGEMARRVRAYRAKNPHKVKEFTKRRKGKKLGRLPNGTVHRIGSAQRWRCAVCRCDLKKSGNHMDHIMPLAKGGQHAPQNIQLLCPPCNVRKSAKDPIAFMQERGFLL
jgi:5-methylcytosine-specific restriction endonuclease McrA